MTSHAQRRRRKIAAQLNVSNRTAANIIKARTAEKREATAPGPTALPNVRHFYLEEETDYEVDVTVDMQTVAYFTMGGGPLTTSGIKNRKFGWFSTWETSVGLARAGWVVDEGQWGPEWEPTERELHDLAAKALADELLQRFKYVIAIHTPDKLAMMASDRPLPASGMRAIPRQTIMERTAPAWWPNGKGRPDIKDPEPVPIDEAQEKAFGSLVVALERANGQVSIEMSKAALGESTGNEPIRAAIRTAREILERVRAEAVTPRQQKLVKRAVQYETYWNRNEDSLNRIDAMRGGVFLPIR